MKCQSFIPAPHLLPPPASADCIALLEDDPMVADLLALTLDQAGWGYQSHGTLASISAAIRARRFDLLILDWPLPDGEADRVIRLARSLYGWDLPILIESVNGEEKAIIGALELGADDYVVKPLRMSEVAARVKALLRRTRRDYPDNLDVGPFRIDAANQRVLLKGEPLSLTAIEYRLACHFLAHPNGLLSRERLLAEVWNRNPVIDTRTVDTHVGRLRRQLRLGAETGWQISTLRGYGYRFEATR